MNAKRMKLADLVVPEKNVRYHTEQQLKEFERSIKMFGQIRPIVIDEKNVILAGNGLYAALKRMGRTEAEVYQYTNLTENQKKKLMIADNRIYSLGVDNLEAMNEIINELVGDLDVPGFDEDMLKQIMADEDEIVEAIEEYGKLDDDEVVMVKEQGERKEAAINRSEAQSVQPAPTISTEQSISTQPVENTDENIERQETQRFVVCPKCGERIWL